MEKNEREVRHQRNNKKAQRVWLIGILQRNRRERWEGGDIKEVPEMMKNTDAPTDPESITYLKQNILKTNPCLNTL